MNAIHPSADAVGVVFVLVWPVILGIAIQAYVQACERLDARTSSRARTHLGDRQC